MEFESEKVKEEFLADYDVLMSIEKKLATITAVYNKIQKKKDELEAALAMSWIKLTDKYEIKANPQGKVVGKRTKTVMTFTGDILKIGGESIYL